MILGILLGIVTLVVSRWLAKVVTRFAARSMEQARVDSMPYSRVYGHQAA